MSPASRARGERWQTNPHAEGGVRVVGASWQGWCSCGWLGELQARRAEAVLDARVHIESLDLE